jgi:hypothetical protein
MPGYFDQYGSRHWLDGQPFHDDFPVSFESGEGDQEVRRNPQQVCLACGFQRPGAASCSCRRPRRRRSSPQTKSTDSAHDSAFGLPELQQDRKCRPEPWPNSPPGTGVVSHVGVSRCHDSRSRQDQLCCSRPARAAMRDCGSDPPPLVLVRTRPDHQNGDHLDTGFIRSVAPEDPPRRGRVVLCVGVPHFHVAVDGKALIAMGRQARMARVLFQPGQRTTDLRQLGLVLVRAARYPHDAQV